MAPAASRAGDSDLSWPLALSCRMWLRIAYDTHVGSYDLHIRHVGICTERGGCMMEIWDGRSAEG